MFRRVSAPHLPTALLLAGALALAGCGGSGGDAPSSSGGAVDADSTDAGGSPAGTTSSDPADSADTAGSTDAGSTDAGSPDATDSSNTGEAGQPGEAGQNGPAPQDALRLALITTTASGVVTPTTLVWDEAGRLLEEQVGEQAALSELRSYEWPSPRRFERRLDDIGHDGTVDRIATFSFGPDGRLSGSNVVDAAGEPIETLGYSVGEDGLVESLVRENGEMLLSRETYDHDAGGELQAVLIDSDGDGRADQVRGYDYDRDGLVTGTTLRSLLDDRVLESSAWRYQRGACITDWMNSVLRPLCISLL